MIGVKITKRATLELDALARTFGEERLLREALVEASKPILDAARANIPKKSGLTAGQIKIDDTIPSEAGVVKITVGIPSSKEAGKGSRAFIGRFLEYGTSKMRAQPWLRPANDVHGGEALVRRVIAFLSSRLQRAA